MTVLVTGARGFVGANVVRRFACEGRVIAVDRVIEDDALASFLGESSANVEMVRADLRDPHWHRLLPPGTIDVVIHAAAVTNQASNEELQRSADAVAVNVGGTINMLDWARTARPRRFVHCSSGAVYGRKVDGEGRLYEKDSVEPRNVYAITKFAAERLALRYREIAGLDIIVARLPSQYGPMERDTGDRTKLSVLRDWCVAAVRGNELRVNRCTLPRDYTYVADVADALFGLAKAPRLRHVLYNITGGRMISYQDVLDVLREHFPDLKVRFYEEDVANPNDRRALSADRLTLDTGWKAQYDLRSGIGEYLKVLESDNAAARL